MRRSRRRCGRWRPPSSRTTAREVLESLTPRQRPVVVAEIDPLALVLGLGETIGAPDDVRALTPWLLRAVVSDDRVDLHTVLSRIAAFWDDWTTAERTAVRDFVDTLWVALLDRHPGPVAALPVATAVSFLDDASGLGDGPARLIGDLGVQGHRERRPPPRRARRRRLLRRPRGPRGPPLGAGPAAARAPRARRRAGPRRVLGGRPRRRARGPGRDAVALTRPRRRRPSPDRAVVTG